LRAEAFAASYLQAFDDPAMLYVLGNNFVDVVLVDIGVPNGLRVYHQDRTFVATVQTAGIIDPDLALAGELERLDLILGIGAHLTGAMIVAANFARLALVDAEENVSLVVTHGAQLKYAIIRHPE
jgi:hypothetical protein